MGSAIGRSDDRGSQGAAGRWGMLFQQGALFSSLTVAQNIQFPIRENLEAVAGVDGRNRRTPSSRWSA